MNERAELSCLVEPAAEGEKDHIQIKMTGTTTGLLALYEQLSLHLFKTMEESYDAGFVNSAYAFMQKRIIEGVPALKKDFDEVEATVKKFGPLMGILGKTFHMGGDK